MSITEREKQLIVDYIFFHFHSPLNTNPEDYRRFNAKMFRAVKLNFMYTLGFSGVSYYFLCKRSNSVLKRTASQAYLCVGITIYSCFQFYSRLKATMYSKEFLESANKYSQDVYRYNDHFKRIYGNK